MHIIGEISILFRNYTLYCQQLWYNYYYKQILLSVSNYIRADNVWMRNTNYSYFVMYFHNIKKNCTRPSWKLLPKEIVDFLLWTRTNVYCSNPADHNKSLWQPCLLWIDVALHSTRFPRTKLIFLVYRQFHNSWI